MATYTGAGLSYFGTSYAGYGSPATVVTTNKKILIDDYGRNGNVRLIDPITQDYRFNDNGYAVGGDGIQQMVYLALLTLKNSSVIANFGQAFSNLKVIGDQYKSQIESEVNSALKALIDRKWIAVQKIDINRSSTNQIRIRISWINLTNDTEYTNVI